MRPLPDVNVTLPSDRQIGMTRTFDAPRHLVFRAMTTPALVQRWLLGPPGWSMPVCEIDLRIGGGFRYVWKRDSTGVTMGMRGIYREIDAPTRITHNEMFDEPWFTGDCLCEQTLAEADGQTLLTTTLTYDSRDVRDGVLKSNMTHGVSASYDRLADVLASGASMIETPRILNVSTQQTATIHLTVPRAKIQSVMGPAMQEVMAAVATQKAKPAGPMFSYHLQMPSDVFDFEVGVPVAEPITASGRVKPSTLPAARIARTIYRGPYEALGSAWGEFNAWLADQKLSPASTLWECYVSGPQASPDPSAWQTELNRPLVD